MLALRYDDDWNCFWLPYLYEVKLWDKTGYSTSGFPFSGPLLSPGTSPRAACSIYSTWNKLLVFEDSFPFSYFPWNLSGFHSIFCVGSSAQDIPKSTAIVVPTSCPQPTFIYRDLSGPWYLFIMFICYNTCLSLEVSKFLVGSMHVCLVTQLCPTLCDTVDCSLPDSSVLRIFQARVLEWGAIAFSL